MKSIDQVRFYIGIDVSKDWFDVSCLDFEEIKDARFALSEQGYAAMVAHVGRERLVQALVCLEATGGYEHALARFLRGSGVSVHVADARKVAQMGHALSRVHKTDGGDAKLLARYARAMRLEPTPVKSDARDRLAEFVSLGELLQKMARQVANAVGSPLRSPEGAAVLAQLEQALAAAQAQAARAMEATVQSDHQLNEERDLLMTIPGIGSKTASRLLALLPAQPRSARSLAAYAGLAPRTKESGSSVRGKARVGKACCVRLRQSLYFPALAAIRHCASLRAFRTKLIERGKSKMQAVIAVMRKLLTAAFGILKHKQPWMEKP